MYQDPKKITITAHARQRLSERFKEIHPSNYNNFVMAARYKGLTEKQMRMDYPALAKYVFNRIHSSKKDKKDIRFYKNAAFIFCSTNNKMRVLRTVIRFDENEILSLINT